MFCSCRYVAFADEGLQNLGLDNAPHMLSLSREGSAMTQGLSFCCLNYMKDQPNSVTFLLQAKGWEDLF